MSSIRVSKRAQRCATFCLVALTLVVLLIAVSVQARLRPPAPRPPRPLRPPTMKFTKAPPTTTKTGCWAPACSQCRAHSSTECAVCYPGYELTSSSQCIPGLNGGAAAPSTGVVTALVAGAVVMCSVWLSTV
ncbi:hypothetical protein NESM_000938500 [Novymonas esmeraldas]|uniref:Uncharacterized protein n=1 Tax=Novymonas esmeraldas TaxID=1808958 RepID=A0AAW0F071_9TRYP